MKEKLKIQLNKEQEEAVLEVDNPVLVLSGAGTGKTRVITHKIAYLIAHQKINPEKIIALTFTNKAAGEMKERANHIISRFMPEISTSILSKKLWIATFHSNCARMLRYHAKLLGFTSNYSIIDVDDKVKILKELISEGAYKHLQKIYRVREDISKAKNNFLDPKDFEERAKKESNPYYFEFAKLFEEYNRVLFKSNSMDFDDLIANMVKIMYKDSEVREYWRSRFDYILVDEFQDTNKSQYLFLKMLMADEGENLTLVGDDDQSIYSFRGATIENILSLNDDFKDLKIIKVVKNYRSTPEILNIANEVIANNKNRLGKVLKPTKEESENIPILYFAENDTMEANFIVNEIQKLVEVDSNNKIAIIYRINSQSRIFEKKMVENNLPYVLLGAKSFYDRKEVKDIIAYLRLIINEKDDIALKRVFNVPTRGIGEVTLKKINKLAKDNDIHLFGAIGKMINEQIDLKIRPSILETIKDFNLLITELKELSENEPDKVLRILLDATDYIKYMDSYGNEMERVQNIEELERYYDSYFAEEKDPTFEGLLQQVSLMDHSENQNKEEKKQKNIFLTTVHGCKGLEFDAVFITGLAEEFFPHSLSVSVEEDLEEERRLFYVAVTRARQYLYLTYPNRVFRNGVSEFFYKSRFLNEISSEFLNVIENNPYSGLKDFEGFFS